MSETDNLKDDKQETSMEWEGEITYYAAQNKNKTTVVFSISHNKKGDTH